MSGSTSRCSTRHSIVRCEGNADALVRCRRERFGVIRSPRPASSPRCSPATANMASPLCTSRQPPALKVGHSRDITQGAQWLFDDLKPVPQLRAVMVVQNEAARQRGLFIAPNMRVPESSLIHRVYADESLNDRESIENLRDWEHSGGKRLAHQEVRIEARRLRDRVIALVQTTSVRTS